MKNKQKYESLFSEIPQDEINKFASTDKYDVEMYKFMACGFEFVIEGDLLAEALSSLPNRSRDIVLLSYFLGLSDPEIADKLNIVRRTVQYQRKNSIDKLKKYMGGKANVKE